MFQYWDAPAPPADVAAWIAGFRDMNPAVDHRLFDRRSGLDWLAETHGGDVAALFASCAVPAMQADFLRLFLIERLGGFYLDADHQPVSPLADMFGQAGGPLLLVWLGLLGNDFLLFPEPGDPFVRAVRRLMVDNVAHRRFDSVQMATEPAVMNAVRYLVDTDSRPLIDKVVAQSQWPGWGWATLLDHAARLIDVDDALRDAYRAIGVRPLDWKGRWLGWLPGDYKTEGGRWADWRGSIYV